MVVLPKILYDPSIYDASVSDLTAVQCFIRGFIRRSVLTSLSFRRQVTDAFFMIAKTLGHGHHQLHSLLPNYSHYKDSMAHLASKSFVRPNINTERFKDSNRLVFKYKLAI